MASCERQGSINKGRMDRWLGLSSEADPMFPVLTLKPHGIPRLREALFSLEHAKHITDVNGRHGLKNVLQCFEPVSALHTPPNKHTGGDTLYGQVAAAYDAYRTGKLDPGAMETVERFTELVLFAIAGNTQEPDQDISSLTYEQELFSGKVNKTLYTTDSLGEHALRTLDHVRTLMGEHRDTLTAKNNRISRQRIGIPLPAKVVGALTAIELILTGCVGHISPTISPTTEATRPAITAPLPTLEPTKTPTIPVTPTETLTPTPVPKPDTSANYPGAISPRTLTDLQTQRSAFTDLVKKNADVATEARTMETRLKLICTNACTTEGVLDQTRWGIIAKNSDGTPLVLQKTTDGGKTWVNVVDASPYSELVANSAFDAKNYRLIPLNRPQGVPDTAKAEVISQNGWMLHVWVDANGKILAWYDAAHDTYLSVDGKKLAVETPYTPFEPGVTTWEMAKKNVVEWPLDNPEQFKEDLAKLHEFDISLEPNIDLISRVTKQILYAQNTGAPEGWLQIELRTESRTNAPKVSVVGYLDNPYGNEMQIIMTQITVTLKNGSSRAFSLPVVRDATAIMKLLKEYNASNDLLNKNLPSKYLEMFKYFDTETTSIIFSKNKLTSEQLNNNWKLLAQLYDYNYDLGVIQRLDRLLIGEGTDEDIEYIIKYGLIPVYQLFPEDNPSINPTDK